MHSSMAQFQDCMSSPLHCILIACLSDGHYHLNFVAVILLTCHVLCLLCFNNEWVSTTITITCIINELWFLDLVSSRLFVADSSPVRPLAGTQLTFLASISNLLCRCRCLTIPYGHSRGFFGTTQVSRHRSATSGLYSVPQAASRALVGLSGLKGRPKPGLQLLTVSCQSLKQTSWYYAWQW